MNGLNSDQFLIIICSLVVVSYIFSIISRYIRIPSVLLLLFAGIGLRYVADQSGLSIEFPSRMIEILGTVGLIMIVFEAGLDLKLGRNKLKLIRNSFFSALVILIISCVLITAILYYWLNQPIVNCIVYAVPLSIMSSSIVIPSLHPLTSAKKEFLIYEASFSDIIGIMLFNYFIADELMTWRSVGIFGANIVISIILSLLLSFILFLVLAKTKLNIKFFLIFSLLILLYAGGKTFHLPSLIIILVFGLMINNWDKIPISKLSHYFPQTQVESLRHLLHSITAESSFLVRTFFFLLFGFSIQLNFAGEKEVLIVGSLIVLALLLVRYLYLRFFLHTNIFPEVVFIPRGLITIVLFYKIPPALMLTSFNQGILFFIILCSSIIMTIGMIFYKKGNEDVIEEGQFSERGSIM
ncbi:MAG TPA: cation:proton antiporter [Chitinophagaceae bacterium]